MTKIVLNKDEQGLVHTSLVSSGGGGCTVWGALRRGWGTYDDGEWWAAWIWRAVKQGEDDSGRGEWEVPGVLFTPQQRNKVLLISERLVQANRLQKHLDEFPWQKQNIGAETTSKILTSKQSSILPTLRQSMSQCFQTRKCVEQGNIKTERSPL